MGSDAFYNARGLLLKSLPVRAEVQAGSAGQPAFMLRARRARRVLWKAMHFIVCGDSLGKPAASRECGRRACNRVQPGGPARIYAPPYGGGRFPMGSDTVLWRGASFGKRRAAGAKRVQAQPAGPARVCAHLPHTRRAEVSMGSDAFCVRILRKDGPAPQARRGCGAD